MESSTSQLSTVGVGGKRLYVYPAEVKGRYRSRKTILSGILFAFFLLVPWIKIGGQPLLLLDFSNGRFSFLGIALFSHDAPLFVFFFFGAALTLAWVTSIWGRVWCGWACPQPVFVDAIFRRIERWIEGDSVVRRRLDESPISGEKIFKKAVKWTLFLVISIFISHCFLAYFIGAEALVAMAGKSPAAHPSAFLAMTGIALFVAFDFGWFREQFCTLICPYGRFQSVLMDDHSLAVSYHAERGEPRRRISSAHEGSDPTRSGDCVACNRCVQVCPTGIDIRNGLQLECVACTACIDECDRVMGKVGRAPRLIRYAAAPRKGFQDWVRPIAYGSILLVLGLTLGTILWKRSAVEVSLIRERGAPFDLVVRSEQDRDVVNRFAWDFQNQTLSPLEVSLGGTSISGVQIVSALLPAELKPGESKKIGFFVQAPVGVLEQGKRSIEIVLEFRRKSGERVETKIVEVTLVGPLR